MAEKFIKKYRLFQEGKLNEVQKIQNEVNIIITALYKVGVMQGEKAVLKEMGIDFGDCRPPFTKLTQKQNCALLKKVMPML